MPERAGAERAIRIVVVDDHAVVRRGLAMMLASYDGLELVGEARNGEEALLVVERWLPDVVLMDLQMPVMDGPAAISAIRERHPEVQVIALTSFAEDRQVETALRAGAISYLLKNITADDLVAAIHAAHRGRSMLANEAKDALLHALQHANDGEVLTERELEVLRLVAQGLTNPEIGERLYVSRATVKFHVSNILTKLGASSRTEAVALAVKQQLIASEST